MYLWCCCCYPDTVVNRIGENAGENVTLSVNFACVDFIEQSHHDEGVEDDGEMLRRRRSDGQASTGINVEKDFTYSNK